MSLQSADYPEINISDEKTSDLEFEFNGQSGLRKPPPPPRLGKKTIYLPCEDMYGESFLEWCWCVKKGLFCFTVRFYTEDDIHTLGKDRQPYKSMPGSAPVLGNNGEYLMLHDSAGAFMRDDSWAYIGTPRAKPPAQGCIAAARKGRVWYIIKTED